MLYLDVKTEDQREDLADEVTLPQNTGTHRETHKHTWRYTHTHMQRRTGTRTGTHRGRGTETHTGTHKQQGVSHTDNREVETQRA